MSIAAAASLNTTTVEAHVSWLCSLTPAEAPAAIARALVAGADEDELWAAGALAAARHLNNQARNLLGFVSHAMIGCEDARRLAHGQPPHTRRLLLLQALAQVVYDLHDPCFAPHSLPPYWPTREATLDANIAMLRSDVRFGEYMRADHRLSALAQDMPRAALLDLLLEIGLEGMVTDDHTVITPVLCLGLIDLLGWEAGGITLRWALRYSSSFPRDFAPYDRALGLRDEHGLRHGAPGDHGEGYATLDTGRVAELRRALLDAEPHRRPQIAAEALAQGASSATVIAATALAACAMYLRAEPVPHADYDAVSREVAPIHLGTALSALRAALPMLAPPTRALAAIMAGAMVERGPSTLNQAFCFVPYAPGPAYPHRADVAALQGLAPNVLLEDLRAALPAHDYRRATAIVQAYADAAAPAAALITLLTDMACTDSGTLLHNFKHLHAMVDEFHSCIQPERWDYLVAAARWVAWYAGKWPEVYQQAAPHW